MIIADVLYLHTKVLHELVGVVLLCNTIRSDGASEAESSTARGRPGPRVVDQEREEETRVKAAAARPAPAPPTTHRPAREERRSSSSRGQRQARRYRSDTIAERQTPTGRGAVSHACPPAARAATGRAAWYAGTPMATCACARPHPAGDPPGRGLPCTYAARDRRWYVYWYRRAHTSLSLSP